VLAFSALLGFKPTATTSSLGATDFFLNFFLVLVTGIFGPIGAHLFGEWVGNHTVTESTTHDEPARCSPPANASIFIVILFGGLFLGILVSLIALTSFRSSYHSYSYIVLFSPCGAWLRWQLAVHFNSTPFIPLLPKGTLAANTFGTMIHGSLVYVTMFSSSLPVAFTASEFCPVISGLSDGLCSSLTTVSTFVLELILLARATSVTFDEKISPISYFLVSVGLSLGVLSIVIAAVLGVAPSNTFLWPSPTPSHSQCP
jgi:fluoride ion exporter CrcB/FEX